MIERIYRYEASSGREKKKFLTVVSPQFPFGEGGKRTLPLLNNVLYLAVAFLPLIMDMQHHTFPLQCTSIQYLRDMTDRGLYVCELGYIIGRHNARAVKMVTA